MIPQINNLLCQQLVDKSKSTTFLKFLCNDLSGVTPSIAKRVIAELGGEVFRVDEAIKYDWKADYDISAIVTQS